MPRDFLLTWLEKQLFFAGKKETAEDFLNNSIFWSVVVGLVFLGFLIVLQLDLISCFIASFVFILLSFFAQFFILFSEKKKKAAIVESLLPFVLLKMSIELSSGNDFLRSLKKSFSNKQELERIVFAIEFNGKSPTKALIDFSETIDSSLVKRSLIQLASVYRQGLGKERGETLRRIASEILSIQKTQAKEFNGKIAVFSLVFIVVSAVLPAMFQAFILIGSSFMDFDFSSIEAFIFVVGVFPLLDLLVLILVKSQTPLFLRGNTNEL